MHLSEENERYPLVVGHHLPVVGVVFGNGLVPRQVVGVLDPAVARHELGVRAGEVDRCPARDRVPHVLTQQQQQDFPWKSQSE